MLILLAAPAGAWTGTPPLPIIPTNVYNILNFGGYGNGVSNNTAAITNAIKAAAATGGGTVLIPANGSLSTYLAGPFNLTNNINLVISNGATLKMFPRATFTNFPNGTSYFINANKLHDIQISGTGTIEGQGTNWWFPTPPARPTMININGSTRVLVENVALQNPPTSHLTLKATCVAVTVQGITINTPGDSPNTDGIDLASTNVLIRNCSISCGDDNIAIGSSAGVSADILVTNCAFGAGHGLSIGSYTSSGVSDLIVSNCTFTGTDTGIRLKSQRDRGGLVQNLRYYDITMTGVEWPIIMYSYYQYGIGILTPMTTFGASTNGPEPVTSTTPIWRDVLVSNVTVTGTIGTRPAIYLWGLPEMPITNVTFCNLNLTGNRGANVWNARAIRFIDSQINLPATTNTFNLWNADVAFSNTVFNTNTISFGGLTVPPTNNVLTLYNVRAKLNETNALPPSPLLTLSRSTLTVSNSLSLGNASTLNFGLGTNITRVELTGNLALGGTLNLSDAGGFTTNTYTLFTYGGALADNGLTIGAVPNTNFSYSISTNVAGQVNLVVSAPPPPPLDPFTAWQLQYFGCTNCPQAAADADPLGKGMNNTNQFLAGLNPTNPVSLFRVVAVERRGDDLRITWQAGGGRTNAVQATTGEYNTNFTDVSGAVIIAGSGDAITNYTEAGGATNNPARYYRVRLVP